MDKYSHINYGYGEDWEFYGDGNACGDTYGNGTSDGYGDLNGDGYGNGDHEGYNQRS